MLESTCQELFRTLPVLRLELGRQLSACKVDLRQSLPCLAQRVARETRCPVPIPDLVDAAWLKPYRYRIVVAGDERAVGSAYPDRLLACASQPERLKGLGGKLELDPVGGLPCRWIPRGKRRTAEKLGATLAEPADLLLRHVEQTLRQLAAERATVLRVGELLSPLEQRHPGLIRRACHRLGARVLLEVLSNLAAEGVSLDNLPHILECLSMDAPRPPHPMVCTEWVRGALAAVISRPLAHHGVLECISLQPGFQQLLWCRARAGGFNLKDVAVAHLVRQLRALLADRPRPVLLCMTGLRPALRNLLRSYFPQLRVLKPEEVDPGLRLQIVDTVRSVSAFPQLGELSLAWALWRLPLELRRRLQAEANNYRRFCRHQSGAPTADPVPEPGYEGPPAPLSGPQRAAVFLLECPTWILREILARLSPREIGTVGREMSRLSRSSPRHRDEVLDAVPGYDPEQPDLQRILNHLRRWLQPDETVSPLQEVGLCLFALGPNYRAISAPLNHLLTVEEAELLRVEVAGLRSLTSVDAGDSLARFAAFYRGAASSLSGLGPEQLTARLQSAVMREPERMARGLMRLWLAPQACRLDSFRHWAAQDPARAACWLVRWLRNWTPPPEGDPMMQARAVLRQLPSELADMLRPHLAESDWRSLLEGPSAPDWMEPARIWLEEPGDRRWISTAVPVN